MKNYFHELFIECPKDLGWLTSVFIWALHFIAVFAIIIPTTIVITN